MPSYYDILGVHKQASDEEIKRAFRRLAMQYHPDRNKSEGASHHFILIQEAYDTLIDHSLRLQYNDRLDGGYVSYFTILTDPYEVPIDPITGRKNYKYHRGKPPKPRDLNAPFDNFETKHLEPSTPDANFTTWYKIIGWGVLGFLLSLLFSNPLSDRYTWFTLSDILITFPFLLFHAWVLLDCYYTSFEHFMLLNKVTNEPFGGLCKLSFSISKDELKSLKYDPKGKWTKDSFYLKKPNVDFTKTFMFVLQKSPIFGMYFEISAIEASKSTKVCFQQIRRKTVVIGSLSQLVLLSGFLYLTPASGVFVFLFFLQIFYIQMVVANNSLRTHSSFKEKLDDILY